VHLPVPIPSVRRVLLAAVAVVLVMPPSASGAALDPLAAAVARVTAAERADNEASARYDAAQARYYELQQQQVTSQRSIDTLSAQQRHLAELGRLRALAAYKRGSLLFDAVLGNGADVMDAARRARMLDDVDAQGDQVMDRLEAVTSELHDRQSTLRTEIADARTALGSMKSEEQAAERALAEAGRAENDLRAHLAAEKRMQELSTILTAARAQSRAAANASAPSRDSGRSGGSGSAGQIIVHGTCVCPVQGAVSFTDTFGSPRSGGCSHKGNDLFAPVGTPLVAVTNGSVFFQADPLGGDAAYVNGNDGNTYYDAHLNDYVGGARSVTAGELIGHVGNTGNAGSDPPQLHFEIRPGGPNGRAIDPYPTLAARCQLPG
jgi:murein DD-endopeptidase MepM/ murein hydrolase activator NlpD